MLTKDTKFKIVCYLSILLLLAGVMIIVSSVVVSQGDGWSFGDDVVPPEIKLTKNFGLAILWIAAIVAIANGIFGIMLSKCETQCLTMLWGSGVGCVAFSTLIIGIVFAAQSSYLPTAVSVICVDKNTPQQQPFMEGSYIDTNMLYQVNRYMCTADCPCDQTMYTNGYSNVDESIFNYAGRTKGASGGGKLGITTTASGGYTVFQKCWTDVLVPSADAKGIDAGVIKNMNAYLKVMKVFEPQYGCSGTCKPALFRFTQPISTMATEGCLSNILTELGGSYVFPGYACIVSAVFMILIFIFQYFLWCKDAQEEKSVE